jgi:succinate dehydrogenase assembly factor 2
MLRLSHASTRLRFLPARSLSTTLTRRADPWPLPHTPEHLERTKTSTDVPPPTPLPRPGETVPVMRARLVYQSRKRGTLESDLLLSTFARDFLPDMSEAELREYDKVCFYHACRMAGSLDHCRL